jgi:hypothetical protein
MDIAQGNEKQEDSISGTACALEVLACRMKAVHPDRHS